jgi:hypothetical protein
MINTATAHETSHPGWRSPRGIEPNHTIRLKANSSFTSSPGAAKQGAFPTHLVIDITTHSSSAFPLVMWTVQACLFLPLHLNAYHVGHCKLASGLDLCGKHPPPATNTSRCSLAAGMLVTILLDLWRISVGGILYSSGSMGEKGGSAARGLPWMP